jgi:tryptophan synthase beta chain
LATFEAGVQFARAEGIIPAPESAHAIRAAIDEALDAKLKGERRVILFNLSGHGNFDMASYQAYFDGKLVDYDYPAEAVQQAMTSLPQVPVMA